MDFNIELPNIPETKIKPIKIKPIHIPRGALPTKRQLIKSVNPNKRLRKAVDADVRHKVWARAKNHCEWRGCKHKENLHIHHKNMNSEDNRLSNLKLLCPNHHAKIHEKYKLIIHEKDLLGNATKTSVVKRGSEPVKKESDLDLILRRFG